MQPPSACPCRGCVPWQGILLAGKRGQFPEEDGRWEQSLAGAPQGRTGPSQGTQASLGTQWEQNTEDRQKLTNRKLSVTRNR